jgi:hypothetical protein
MRNPFLSILSLLAVRKDSLALKSTLQLMSIPGGVVRMGLRANDEALRSEVEKDGVVLDPRVGG